MTQRREIAGSGPMPVRTTDAVSDLFSALDRLVRGNTVYVSPPYSINKRTVCREAGRDPSTIKVTGRFAELRRAIDLAAPGIDSRQTHRNGRSAVSANQKEEETDKIGRLQDKVTQIDHALDCASEHIFRLHRQLAELEDDRCMLIEKLHNAQRSSAAVQRSFRLLGIQRIIDEHFAARGDRD